MGRCLVKVFEQSEGAKDQGGAAPLVPAQQQPPRPLPPPEFQSWLQAAVEDASATRAAAAARYDITDVLWTMETEDVIALCDIMQLPGAPMAAAGLDHPAAPSAATAGHLLFLPAGRNAYGLQAGLLQPPPAAVKDKKGAAITTPRPG